MGQRVVEFKKVARKKNGTLKDAKKQACNLKEGRTARKPSRKNETGRQKKGGINSLGRKTKSTRTQNSLCLLLKEGHD